MSEDYARGYRDGFKHGFEQGKNSVGLKPWNPVPQFPQPGAQAEPKCAKCGIEYKNMMYYCCMRMDCPSKIVFYEETQIKDPGAGS